MSEKRRPLKPDRPLSSIIFSDSGKVRLATERLPRTQDELELAIGRKFLGALAHFQNRRLTDLTKGAGRGDLLCLDEGRSEIKIQVVEAVDPIASTLMQRRRAYSEALLVNAADVLERFAGCRLFFIDSGNVP